MQALRPHYPGIEKLRFDRALPVGAGLMALAALLAIFFAVEENGGLDGYAYLFLLPWIFGLALIFLAPTAYWIYRGEFSLANPIAYATWTYLIPAFVLGGLFLASGWSQPYFLDLIQDPAQDLPFTIVLVGLGYVGLCAGYFLPLGRKIGGWIDAFLPKGEFASSAYLVPSWVLFGLGTFNTVFAFVIGLLGFQVGQINSYDGLIYLTTLFWTLGIFLLWTVIFREQRPRPVHFATAGFLIILILGRSAMSGTRGNLLLSFITVLLAYVLSGRRLAAKHYLAVGSVAAVLLTIGMIYGSTFRAIKGTEERQEIGDYAENVAKTVDEVGKTDPVQLVEFSFARISERLDIVSSVAVVVSNYEQLRPYEEAYGVSDNIWTDLTTFLIPRVFWEDKPVASDARRVSDLYFNYGESSTAITPFGDLLRNFGPIGVPVGMFFLGILLRIIYRALVEDQPARLWRIAIYFMLLMSVSFEGFYGTIIPYLVKDGITAIVGVAIVCLLAKLFTSGIKPTLKTA